jgi:hypothetical protein
MLLVGKGLVAINLALMQYCGTGTLGFLYFHVINPTVPANMCPNSKAIKLVCDFLLL